MAKHTRFWHKLWNGTDFGKRLHEAGQDSSGLALFDFVAEHYVSSGQTVVLSCGTTMALLGQSLFSRAADKNFGRLEVITPNLEVFLEWLDLKNDRLRLSFPPGEIELQNGSTRPPVSALAGDPKPAIASIFLSFAGFSSDHSGFFDEWPETWGVKHQILEILDNRHKFSGDRKVVIVLRGKRLGIPHRKGRIYYGASEYENHRARKIRFALITDVPNPSDEKARRPFDKAVAALTSQDGPWQFTQKNGTPPQILVLSAG